jgi:hypothetical protein
MYVCSWFDIEINAGETTHNWLCKSQSFDLYVHLHLLPILRSLHMYICIYSGVAHTYADMQDASVFSGEK